MRYGPAERLLRLACRVAASRTGLTLDEMAQGTRTSRRTVERMRDSLASIFPQLESWDDDARIRRWRLPPAALVGIVSPTPDCVAAVELAARACAEQGEADRAGLLRDAAATLCIMMRPDALRRAEPDIEALMEAEGIALRPGPRPVIAEGVLPTLRRAILGMQLVSVRYAARGVAEPSARILCPYGLLHGGRGWLVAHVESLPKMHLWRLDRLLDVELLDRQFPRDPNFSLDAWSAGAFGVFREPPIDVVLRADASIAADARLWHFHRTQHFTEEADGSLTIRFVAGGEQEIVWHVFTWSPHLRIVAPDSLRSLMHRTAQAAADLHSP